MKRSPADRQARSRRQRAAVVAAALALALAAAGAARYADSPRLLVLCAAAALLAVVVGLRGLLRLSLPEAGVATEPPFGMAADAAAQHEAWLMLESRLEYAPVALWQVRGGEAAPLNAAARRLLAPGRAVSAAALLSVLREAPVGQRKLVSFDSERGQERAVLAATKLVLEGREEALLALMPIESELEAETLDAWRQLVHVLTHEIMNSLTPIASLSRTAQELVAEREGADALDAADLADLDTALDAIARRASDLADFVAGYRSVSELPAPKLEVVELAGLFERLERLVAPGWRARGGGATFRAEPASLELLADPGQLEQALLNLLQNATDATAAVASPEAEVTARLVRGSRLAIEVRDNGPGVAPGLEASIFTPFFSTRKNGLGVGLALVRNLVHGMGGTVRYSKRVSGGACFVLAF